MNTIPERKPTRLKNFDYDASGAYFITICTKERKKILSDIVGDDAHIVPKRFGLVAEKYIKTIPGIDKYVIMPDHIHMIIVIDGTMWASSPTQNISQTVKTFKTLVTKELGFSIFQRSFYDHVIRNRDDYNEHVEYIRDNPMRWYYNNEPNRP